MPSIFQETRHSLRQLRRSPGFTAAAVLTLALGIGATTAIFTLIYQVILRSIPVSQPDQLYKIGKEIECCIDGGLQPHWRIFSYDLYKYLGDTTPDTAGMAAIQAGATTLSVHRANDSGNSQPLDLRLVSGNYFSVLGVQPYAGRLLTMEDDRPAAEPVAVVSYRIWQSKFAGDPHLLGSTLLFAGHPVTIVGITVPGFNGERNTEDPPGIWAPLSQQTTLDPTRDLLHFTDRHWLDILVRIPNKKNVPAIQNAIRGELHQWVNDHKQDFLGSSESDFAKVTTELTPAASGINDLGDSYAKNLRLLMLAAGFVLLIACANLANLMIVRGMARQQELSLRTALGAPRWGLVRQVFTESILLALFGGIAALIIAYAGTRGILAMVMRGADFNPISATPSLPVLGFALALSVVTGIVFGIAPAWITSRANPAEALRGANRSTRDSSALPQKILVILQVALSLALLSTAGLLITSMRQLEQQDFRFDTHGRLLLFIDLPAAGYKYDQLAGLYQRMDDTFSRLPGVQNFAYGIYSPMSENNWSDGIYMPDLTPNVHENQASFDAVSPAYFQAVGTRLLLGRNFTEEDTGTGNPVAVVNQAFVRKFIHGKYPLGEHLGDRDNPAHYEIIGVVEDTKYRNPDQPVPPMYFTSIRQTYVHTKPDDIAGEQASHFANNIVFHYQGDPASISASVRQAMHSIDPQIPITRMLNYDEQVGRAFTQTDLVVRLTSLFGLLALLLAAIGLYGVTAYSLARRTREIGVRMALGASRGNVLAMVTRTALLQTAVGLAIGLPLAYTAARLLQHTLYQTSALQPLVLLAATAMLLVSSLLASFIPARRAASIDPMKALRIE